MRLLNIMLICIFIVVYGCPTVAAYTLTFDDVPSGTMLSNSSMYYLDYGANFADSFQTADHTNSEWGKSLSSPNVVIWTGDPYSDFASLKFGHYTWSSIEPCNVSSLDAYFSTDIDAVVKLTAYNWVAPSTLTEVANALIGESGQSWDNQYVEIKSAGNTFNMLTFQAVAGSNGLQGFCVDNMTVTPVPEPSSLLALLCGIGGISGMIWRRKR